jgi:hypothetical protein
LAIDYTFSSSAPANGDFLYRGRYNGFDSAGNSMRAVYDVRVADVTSDSERVGFYWSPINDGASAAMFDINYTTAKTVTIMDGSYDFDIASHDGTNGLKLAGTLVTSTASEINLLDGGTSIAAKIGLSDGDGIFINDGGTSKLVEVESIKDYVEETNVQNVDNLGTLQIGFNYFSSLAGAESCTLPASPTVGNIVRIKAPSNCSSTNTITINKAGSHTIDGETAIVLESPYSGVSLCYVASNTWLIF